MIRFANPLWLLLVLAIAGRFALLIRDRQHRFGAFTISARAMAGRGSR